MAAEVFSDDHLLVVNKPSGVDSQRLYEELRTREPKLALHHRLDQPASGLLLMARDPAVNGLIAAGFREHTIRREYRAVLMGECAERCTWNQPLDGKDAETRVIRLGVNNGMSAVEVRLTTGRTHQIRKHAAMVGLPIAGDRRYGAEAGRAWPRLALHAFRMVLEHPVSGVTLELTADLPNDLDGLWSLAC